MQTPWGSTQDPLALASTIVRPFNGPPGNGVEDGSSRQRFSGADTIPEELWNNSLPPGIYVIGLGLTIFAEPFSLSVVLPIVKRIGESGHVVLVVEFDTQTTMPR